MTIFNSALTGLSSCLDCLANFKTNANKGAGTTTNNINKVVIIKNARPYSEDYAAPRTGEAGSTPPGCAACLTWGQGVRRTGNIPRYGESALDNPLHGMPGKITWLSDNQ